MRARDGYCTTIGLDGPRRAADLIDAVNRSREAPLAASSAGTIHQGGFSTAESNSDSQPSF